MWNGKVEALAESQWIKRCLRKRGEIDSMPAILIQIEKKEFWADSIEEALRWARRNYTGAQEIRVFKNEKGAA